MAESLPPRLPEVSEAQAQGETSRIYEELKTLSGVPMVALIYRHLATIPGGLEWAWSRLYPALVGGELQERAWSLTSQLELDSPAAIPRPALRVLDVSAEDEIAIKNVLDAYNRANPVNILSVAFLRLCLRTSTGEARDSGTVQASWFPPQRQGPLAPMVDPAQMSSEMVELVDFLGNYESPCDRLIVPSLYRHLAQWPEFLAMSAAVLVPHFDLIAEYTNRLQILVEEEAASLPLRFGGGTSDDLALAEQQNRQTLEAAFETFTGKIPEMVIIGTLLYRALPKG